MYKTVQQIPTNELPYEKCRRYGAGALSDAELLAVILRTGTTGINAVELAHRILGAAPGGLDNLYRLSIREFTRIPGIGQVKAAQLQCLGELSKRIAMNRHKNGIVMDRASSVARYYMEQLRYKDKECLMVCMFDTRCRLLGDARISVGTVNTALFSPREIFLKALEWHAVHIILLHNHPSGVALPSEADCQATERIRRCGEILNITLSDHIIIGDSEYYSFREHGMISSEGR